MYGNDDYADQVNNYNKIILKNNVFPCKFVENISQKISNLKIISHEGQFIDYLYLFFRNMVTTIMTIIQLKPTMTVIGPTTQTKCQRM